MPAEYTISDMRRCTMTATVRTTPGFRVRVCVAVALVRLAAAVLRCGLKIDWED